MTPWVTRLLIANIGVFFLTFTRPAIGDALAFVPYEAFRHPWTIITYMFVHAGVGHIFWNMAGLAFLGPQVEAKLGSDRFVTLYFISGIGGAVLSFFLAPVAGIVGASGAVLGVMLAFAYFWPRQQLMIWGIIPVEARWMVALYTVFSIGSGAMGSRFGVADFAHLGGFVGAYAYLRWLKTYTGVAGFRAKTAPKVADRALTNWKRVDPKSVHSLNRDELNRILDKANASGLPSLTAQERAFLLSFVPMDDRPPVS